ncbi:MAG: phage tail sheath subtilisin-like domain-containing protein [Anaerolineales bacterium]|nr:phage tail sheath subtilisin-like domain-containing protein [Anaerolineales bacterium]
MPEYLAPGVYVEEVDTGTKPIEGVSTSTSGMVGVTERGPVNVPILITSVGEYNRWFGERLSILDFANSISDRHCYLPHAVQGFFDNGGKRVFVTRVLDTVGARKASSHLFDRGGSASADTVLLRGAAELTGTSANLPKLIVLDGSAISSGDWIRIGDGSRSEYRKANAAPAFDQTLLAPGFPLLKSHDAGSSVIEASVVSGTVLALEGDAAGGSKEILVKGTTANIGLLAADDLLEISGGNAKEYRFIASAPTVTQVSTTESTAAITLDSPLSMSYADGDTVDAVAITTAGMAASTLATPCLAGDRLLFAQSNAGFTAGNILIVDPADSSKYEARTIGALSLLTLAGGAYEEYPAGSIVEEVTLGVDTRAVDDPANYLAGVSEIVLDDVSGLAVGQSLILGAGTTHQETRVIKKVTSSSNSVQLTAATGQAHDDGEEVIPKSKNLTAAAAAGADVLALDNRLGLAVGDLIRISDAAHSEYLTVKAAPGRPSNPVAPDAGNLVVAPPVANSYALGSEVVRAKEPEAVSGTDATINALEVPEDGLSLLVTRNSGFAANDFLRLTTASGEAFYHQISAVSAPTPDTVEINEAVLYSHPAGSCVVGRKPLFNVQALDAGAWGNRLRISVEDESPGQAAQTNLTQFGPPTRIRLSSYSGIEPGTVLEVTHPTTKAVTGGFLKVEAINRANGDITLAGAGLDATQQAAFAALPSGSYLKVRSREFALTVRLLRQPDAAVPSRNDTVIDSETYRYLSMDSRHSRYIHKVIGDIDGALRLSDRRTEGESAYIRVHDTAQDLADPAKTTALESVRVGPEALVDILPSGSERPARHALYEGFDSIGTLVDDDYIGADSTVPENRTGLHALRNIEEISIVAIPGRTSMKIQNALINHCEQARYRFAVLDGPQPPKDTLTDVQDLRQQFDTKYAAIYYPWLVIPDPYPTNLAKVGNYTIPPSGHLLGIYARTDIERGVHKAPANEVVRGITGLQRLINKEQQDILNPYPVNINVIRDFRPNNRGIRVYGGRVITSDSDWKYVNVRRLLIFIEASIERGLQWVVFEPNAEPLWARVRRSISNFLTLVWRNGALEGTKPEEAYFVKCDRTTMTQTDIDSGRLICLIGVAPVKPAEYVIIRIGLWTAHAED